MALCLLLPYAYKLQKGDVLYISLTTDDEKLNKIFIPGAGGDKLCNKDKEYLVQCFILLVLPFKNGTIEFPYLGKIKVDRFGNF
jgi:hypothetical protein